MRSPYVLFLRGIAKLVNGEVPEHYDYKWLIRLVLSMSIITHISIVMGTAITAQSIISNISSIPMELMMIIGMLLMIGLFTAYCRFNSIMKYIFNRKMHNGGFSTQNLIDFDTMKQPEYNLMDQPTVKEELILLIKPMKVFAIVLVFTYIPFLAYLITSSAIFLEVQVIVFPLLVYYQFIFLILLIHLISIWRQNPVDSDFQELAH